MYGRQTSELLQFAFIFRKYSISTSAGVLQHFNKSQLTSRSLIYLSVAYTSWIITLHNVPYSEYSSLVPREILELEIVYYNTQVTEDARFRRSSLRAELREVGFEGRRWLCVCSAYSNTLHYCPSQPRCQKTRSSHLHLSCPCGKAVVCNSASSNAAKFTADSLLLISAFPGLFNLDASFFFHLPLPFSYCQCLF